MGDKNYILDEAAWNRARAEIRKILRSSPGLIAETAIRCYLDSVEEGKERVRNDQTP